MIDAQAYLLAAGNGRRAGGPKAWALHHGRTLLETQLDFLKTVVGSQMIGVTIQADWADRCSKLGSGARFVPVDPHAKPMGALQALVRACPPAGWVFVHHVDMPVWEPKLFESVYAARSGDATAPKKDGHKGHPVLLSKETCEALLKLDPEKDRLDVFLRGRKESAVETTFDCIFANWNAEIPA
jgi:CTP:molybdopterin cytidylyltransferase MocA